MLSLRSYVCDRVSLLRNSDDERRISFLPREITRMCLVHPQRRRSFCELHGLRKRHSRGQGQQNVNVIFGAADDQRFKSVLAGDAPEEGPELRLDLRLD